MKDEREEAAAALVSKYHATFTMGAGPDVLEHLDHTFPVMFPCFGKPGNPDFNSKIGAKLDGQKDVIRHIRAMIAQHEKNLRK